MALSTLITNVVFILIAIAITMFVLRVLGKIAGVVITILVWLFVISWVFKLLPFGF